MAQPSELERSLALLGAFAGGVVGTFMLGRWVVLWYFRIDRVVELLESIEKRLPQQIAPPPAP